MALDLLLACLVVLSLRPVSTARSYASGYMSMRVMDTAANCGVVGNLPTRPRRWTTLFRGVGGEVVPLTTLLPLARLVIGGRTTN